MRAFLMILQQKPVETSVPPTAQINPYVKMGYTGSFMNSPRAQDPPLGTEASASNNLQFLRVFGGGTAFPDLHFFIGPIRTVRERFAIVLCWNNACRLAVAAFASLSKR